MARAIHLALLSEDKIAFFRAQVVRKREAAFLAPQFLEQIAILVPEVKKATDEIAAMRAAIAELEQRLASVLTRGGDCPACQHTELREAVALLHDLAYEE